MAEESRREPRTRVMLRTRLRARGPECEACLLDVSSRGLLMTAAEAPPRGTFVEVRAGSHSLVGVVEWAAQRRFGVVLRERIDTAALIRGDADAITLKGRSHAQAAAGRAAQPLFAGAQGMARAAQFGGLVAAGVGAAVLLAQTVEHGLAPLQQARTAMAQTR